MVDLYGGNDMSCNVPGRTSLQEQQELYIRYLFGLSIGYAVSVGLSDFLFWKSRERKNEG